MALKWSLLRLSIELGCCRRAGFATEPPRAVGLGCRAAAYSTPQPEAVLPQSSVVVELSAGSETRPAAAPTLHFGPQRCLRDSPQVASLCYNRAMSGNSKVLTGLMERRALEAAFAALASATNAEELARQADEIAGHGSAALPVLLARLDTDDPALRGGLAQVALRLDRELVVAALRGMARSQDRSDRARLSALTILDRYLDEPIDDSLLAGIQDPDGVALRSLNELIAAMAEDEAAVIEYLVQLAEQPPEVLGMILDAVPRMPPHPHLVTLLRMIAQGESQPRARTAIEQLGRFRIPEALSALDALALTLSPTCSALAERGARKLRMSGVRGSGSQMAVEAATWRALLSPVDGAGVQVILFVHRAAGQDTGTLLTVVTREPDGIAACFGSNSVPVDRLPPDQPIGSIYTFSQGEDAPAIQLLESGFDPGRYVVRAALERHWASETLPPLEYRYFNPLLWNAGPLAEAAPSPGSGSYSPAQTVGLLDHPIFAGWFWRDDAMFDAARRLKNGASTNIRARQIGVVATAHFSPEVVASYRRRLEAMADWLTLAAQPETAALARSAAKHISGSTAAESPFIRRLIGIGLDVATVSLQTSRI